MTRQDKDWPLCDCCLNHVAHKQGTISASPSGHLDLIATRGRIVDTQL